MGGCCTTQNLRREPSRDRGKSNFPEDKEETRILEIRKLVEQQDAGIQGYDVWLLCFLGIISQAFKFEIRNLKFAI